MSDRADEGTRVERAGRGIRVRGFVIACVRVSVLSLMLLGVLRWTAVIESLAFMHPNKTEFQTPREYEDVWITTRDGVRLHAWFMPAVRSAEDKARGPAPAVLHVHGNAATIREHAGFSEFLRHRGVSVLIFDYRSYGRSQQVGRLLTREQLLEDSRAALDVLRSRANVDASRIGVYGVSLGGSFAMALAAEHPEIRCVCTLSTFSSWLGVALDHVPILPRALIRSGQSAAENAAKLGGRPLLIVHGDQDPVVPVRHAQIIQDAAERAGVTARTLVVRGAGHEDTLDEQHGDAEDAIAGFFQRELSVKAAE